MMTRRVATRRAIMLAPIPATACMTAARLANDHQGGWPLFVAGWLFAMGVFAWEFYDLGKDRP